MKYVYGFILLCSVVVLLSLQVGACCFANTGYCIEAVLRILEGVGNGDL